MLPGLVSGGFRSLLAAQGRESASVSFCELQLKV